MFETLVSFCRLASIAVTRRGKIKPNKLTIKSDNIFRSRSNTSYGFSHEIRFLKTFRTFRIVLMVREIGKYKIGEIIGEGAFGKVEM
jgi:hypothetical protein